MPEPTEGDYLLTETKTRGCGPLRTAWVLLAALGCGDDGPTEPVATSISVDALELRFTAWAESQQVVATVSDQFGMPLEATVVWSVDDPEIAAVTDDGIVTSLANGVTSVTATFDEASASVPVEVDAVGPFNIRIHYVSSLPAGHKAAVERVERRWESIIRSELPDVDFSENPIREGECVTSQPAFDGVVDDVQLYVVARFLDGVGGNVGGAQPCLIRPDSHLTAVGVVIFDYQDIATMTPEETELLLTHEMAHALGLGNVWRLSGLLAVPSLENGPGADTHFNGPLAVAAFDAAGGTAYVGGKVPVHNTGGSGTADRHWRESVLGNELMTPTLDRDGFNPLSAITIQSLADIGYAVDVGLADAYALPAAAGVRGRAVPPIRVDDDDPGLPIRRVGLDGRVTGVVRASGNRRR